MTPQIQKIKSAFQNQNTNNQIASKNIEVLHQLLDQKTPINVFIQTLKHWPDEQPLKIHNYKSMTALGLMVLFIILGFVSSIYFFIPSIFLFFYTGKNFTPPVELNDFQERLKLYFFEQRYNIKFSTTHTEIKPDLVELPFLKLGNHQNTLKVLLTGQLEIKQKSYPYTIFNYHYINQSKSKNSKGEVITKDRHKDLWGVLIENFPYQGISISSRLKIHCRLAVDWKSSDIVFNQRYQQSGVSELAIIKFLTPERLLLMEQIMLIFPGDFYVDPATSAMYWLFNEMPLTENNTLSKAETMSEFAEQLEVLSLPKLEALNKALTNLLKEL
ncbi:hypothetical protein [Acinetobacter colistiniresistens]|uniref:hypothetical protein n=1 Tax=Acinetobacter colistiniresistens TaxID=280145 RepID=UPI0012500D1D|nr:hypothetical protein [Acinetobacter colistiniresistens]